MAIKIARILVETRSSVQYAIEEHAPPDTAIHQRNMKERPHCRSDPQMTRPLFETRGDRKGMTCEQTHRTPSCGLRFAPKGAYSGHEILCALGGGYLVVTVLCTLNRAVPASTPMNAFYLQLVERSGRHPAGNALEGSNDAGSFGVTQEVNELLLLLTSLLQLGCPTNNYLNGTPAYGEFGEHALPLNEHGPPPPLVKEVDDALAAAAPSGRRRRVSIEGERTHAARSEASRVAKGSTAEGSGRDELRPGCKGSFVYAQRSQAKTCAFSALRTETLAQSGNEYATVQSQDTLTSLQSGSASRRPSVGERTSSFSQSSMSRTVPQMLRKCNTQTNLIRDASGDPTADVGKKVSLGLASLPPGFLATSRAGSARGLPVLPEVPGGRGRGKGTQGREKRISSDDFNISARGNFAVLLANRWSPSEGHNGRERPNATKVGKKSYDRRESGFDMLARFVLQECDSYARATTSDVEGRSSLSKEQPRQRPRCGQGSGVFDKKWWWKNMVQCSSLGSKVGAIGNTDLTKASISAERRWENTQRSFRGGDERGGKIRHFAGVNDGGRSVRRKNRSGKPEASCFPRAGQLAILVTEIIRDYFLGQVTTMANSLRWLYVGKADGPCC